MMNYHNTMVLMGALRGWIARTSLAMTVGTGCVFKLRLWS